MKKPLKTLVYTGPACLLLVLLAALLQAFFGAPVLYAGLRYEVYARDLDEVSALAFDKAGDLYTTLEKRHGQGELLQIHKGKAHKLLDNLDKPDGILLRDSTLYLTNEAGSHGLAVYTSGSLRYLDGTHDAEGIAGADHGRILVIEDRKAGGRLLRIEPSTARVEVLLEGLHEGEGVCQTPGGDIYFVEKTSDHLSRYRDGKISTAVAGLDSPAFLNCLDDGSILLTEDRTNFGRLLHYRQGAVEVLATHLRSPQSVIIGPDGAYYLAEQRKSRILRIYAP
ncbi:MAG TPA: hypothetical protein VET88_10160 [Gammaproteobacteria bacterium]|nr:hypothetical protein [Gammaproteobacteria bacterium]